MWLEKMAQHLFKAVRELLQSQQNIVTSHNRLCTLTRQQLAASADSFAGQFVEGPVRQTQTILLDEVIEVRDESVFRSPPVAIEDLFIAKAFFHPTPPGHLFRLPSLPPPPLSPLPCLRQVAKLLQTSFFEFLDDLLPYLGVS